MKTIGELKKTLKTVRSVYVWVTCYGDEGEYIEVSKAALLRAVRDNDPQTRFNGEIRDGDFYVN
jgi:hypothetical protein